ncbi:MAG: hypothetical protein RLO03_13870 [Balneola sp.]
MPTQRITIHFENNPIRIFGLPDDPVFAFQDIASIVGKRYSIPNYELIPELEAFSLTDESLSVVNCAGVYKMIFNAGDEIQALDFEKFFIREVEPALRKYGYPNENSSC